MPPESRDQVLLDTARIGIGFEHLKNNTFFQVLIEDMRVDALAALERVKRLSPFTQQGEIAECLQLANTYDLIVAKIERRINEGLQAQAELERPEPFTDE